MCIDAKKSNISVWYLSTLLSTLSSIGKIMKSRLSASISTLFSESRLSASISTLFSGKQRRLFSKEILISSSNINFLNGKCRSFSSFLHQHFVAPTVAVINSYSEDDFSELGQPVEESAASQLKLKTAPAGKAPVSSFQYQGFGDFRRAVHNFSSEDDFSELGPPVAGSAVTLLKLATEKREPPFLKTDPTGKASAKSYKGVLKTQSRLCKKSESSGRGLPNQPLNAVKNVMIRIQGIAKETTDPKIHSLCSSTGVLEGFARKGTDSVDALFRVKSGTDAQTIVQRLNETIINDCHWSACEMLNDLSLSISEEVGSKLCTRINSRLSKLKKQFDG